MKLDLQQKKIKDKLDQLLTKINKNNYLSIILSSLFNKKKYCGEGLYIYGSVGRGKSHLMHDFYKSCNDRKKIYIHFNSFMHQLHQSLHKIRQHKKMVKNDLIIALNNVLRSNCYQKIPNIICFDEFQIADIADAMILSRIFKYIFEQKIIVIFTSNSHPLKLYENGLQRELFIQFVENILLKKCQVLHLDSEVDYRLLKTANSYKKYLVNNLKNRQIFLNYIENFTRDKAKEIKKIYTFGRELLIKNSFGNVAIFSAKYLFYEQLYSADYQNICKNYDLIFIKNLKSFTSDEANEIKRFTLFIDEIYEHKVALIILAKKRIDKLLDDETLIKKYSFFARTISRLKEIKSLNYWQESKFTKK